LSSEDPLLAQWPAPHGEVSFTVSIPEIILRCPVDGHTEWKRMRQRWIAGGFAEPSALGPFASLAEGGRIHSFRTEQPSFGYPEALTATALERDGWTCWTAVQLFPFHGRQVKAEAKRRVTEEVEALLAKAGVPVPARFRTNVNFVPKNPDLVCYHATRVAWRFAEVKRDEPVHQAQLDTLAYLHWLTGAEVAIVRVVPEGARRDERSHEGRFVFRGTLPRRSDKSVRVPRGGTSGFGEAGLGIASRPTAEEECPIRRDS
jgi:hypothetical protein